MNNTAIKVSHLTKVYKLYDKPIDRLKEALHPLKKQYHKDFYALSDVSFEIQKGETVGIIGKNGAGKSTLLKIITGVLTPTSGSVHVNGRIASLLELGAGFNPEYTGIENIYFLGSLMGYTREEMEAKVDDIIQFADIGDFVHQPVKMYSSGMFARLAFAVNINVNPDILIVDEALSVGDTAFQRKCFAKMEEIRSKGATILFVSHSEGSIVALCSRAIWISNGQQIIDGTPKLVTGLYMKHINENKIDKSKIEKEYEALANNKEEEKSQEKKRRENTNSESIIQHSILKNSPTEEFFNPALKPKSTIYYEENGAKINDVKITTLDGEEVNVLSQDKYYKVLVGLDVLEDVNNLRLGIRIKDIQGISISGCAYELKKHSEKIKISHGKYEIVFLFKAIIIGESFLIDIAVTDVDNGNQFLHRVNDVYMFKVNNINHVNLIQGKTSMFQECVINEIK